MATRNELVTALAGRYARSSKAERGVILDEFVAVSGYHRALGGVRPALLETACLDVVADVKARVHHVAPAQALTYSSG